MPEIYQLRRVFLTSLFLFCVLLGSGSASTLPVRSAQAQAPASPQPGVTGGAATQARREIQIGKIYNDEDRLEDAEKAYAKAIESASGAELKEAKDDLRAIASKRASFKTKYLRPLIEDIETILLRIVELFAFGFLLWWPLKILGRQWGRRRVRIDPFTDATDDSSGAGFGYVLKNAIGNVQDYYELRDRLRFVTFLGLEVVEASAAPEWSDLVTEVVPGGAGKLLTALLGNFFKPKYSFSGVIQKISPSWALIVRFSERGSTIRVWDQTYSGQDFIQYQKGAAYEAAIFLKNHVGS